MSGQQQQMNMQSQLMSQFNLQMFS